MPTHKVNLDALIVREVLEVQGAPEGGVATVGVLGITIGELEPSRLWASALRKPDFQRATADWSPDTVAELVKSFVQGELIPSLILWRSPSGRIFVIDGAHRLSALLAWVNDDYGDRAVSNAFFRERINKPQKTAASETRKLIEASVGSYLGLKAAGQQAQGNPSEREVLGRGLASTPIPLQWVPGSTEKAASSFFKINQRAVAIDQTELDMIQCRRKPNGIAARALISAGAGHRYWSGYSLDAQKEIEALALAIHDALFSPPYDEPIKTLDLPIAGHIYSGDNKGLVWDLVNHMNQITPDMWREPNPKSKKKQVRSPLTDDANGSGTIAFLQSIKKITDLIAGTYARSLGLHPNVYFWSATGKVQPSAVLGTMEFVRGLSAIPDGFLQFSKVRSQFEEFILSRKHYVNQIVNKYGSGTRSLRPMAEFFQTTLEQIQKGHSGQHIAEALQALHSLRHLKDVAPEGANSRAFSRETKSAAFIRDALEKALRCKECGARLHFRSITIDHATPVRDGGSGDVDNAQLMHPFCNTGLKEHRSAKGAGDR